jgi:hypothetical protein
VFDARVVSYRGEHQPLTCSPALTVTAKKAHEIALANMPSKTLECVQWLEETPEVVTLDEAQRCVWTLIAELGTIRRDRRPQSQRPDRSGRATPGAS